MTTSPKYAAIKIRRLAPDKVAELLESPEILILDVRPIYFSRNNYFLEKSVHIPMLNLEEMAVNLPKDKTIIITDWAMKQSPIAAKFLISKGYRIMGVLKGGIERWTRENRPTSQKGTRSPAEIINSAFH